MLNIGLTSVTFRELGALDVIKYCTACGISAIEWGSDVHLPVKDTENARLIKAECDKAGISVSSYGSYYRCGRYEDAKEVFADYLEIAKIIKAPTIRIWAGEKNYGDADSAYIEKIASELQMICDMAKAENIEIGCEFHGGTLCNTRESSLDIVKRVARDNFGMYFQYDPHFSVCDNCETLKSFLPILKNIHVFCIDTERRYSLSENGGEDLWGKFTDILKENNVNSNLLFEFLSDSTCEGLLKETEILRKIINA